MSYIVMVRHQSTPSGYGMAYDEHSGSIRPLSPCCEQLIDHYHRCESCGTEHEGSGYHGSPVNNRWIGFEPGNSEQWELVHEWVELILGTTVDLTVDWS